MPEGTYWGRRRLSRRAAIRGAGIGLSGLAGALFVGCGGDDDTPDSGGGGATATGTESGGGGGGAVPPEEVRLPGGTLFQDVAPPTAAEMDPLANGKYGGTLTFRQFDSPHFDFNRVLSSTVNTPNDLTKNKLFRLHLGASADPGAIDIEPDLARSFEVNDDATEFTFHLQEGAKFHNVDPVNGREFTSDDARASIERYQAGGVQKDVWAPVIGIETPDDYTLVLKLDQPFAEFPRTTASWSYMDARETIEIPDFLRDHPVGTGPFIQTEWVPKERQVFEKHPEYFETGFPFLDRVVGQVQEDAAAIRAAFQTGNFVELVVSNADEAAVVLGNTDTAVMVRQLAVQGANVNGFHFQMNNPKYQDERVRRAFSMAIDRIEWDLASRGPDDATGGFSNPPIAWRFIHDDLPTLEDHGPWYQYDPEQASQMLQAAGYSAENPLTAVFKAWYARNDWSQIMIPQLNRLPELELTFEQVDNPTAVTLLNDRNFEDPVNITWGPPAYSVDQMVYPWYHSQGGLNHNNKNDAQMDELVTAQRREQDDEARRDIWRQVEERYMDQVWEVFTPAAVVQRRLWHNWALNYRPHGLGYLTIYATHQLRGVWLDNI